MGSGKNYSITPDLFQHLTDIVGRQKQRAYTNELTKMSPDDLKLHVAQVTGMEQLLTLIYEKLPEEAQNGITRKCHWRPRSWSQSAGTSGGGGEGTPPGDLLAPQSPTQGRKPSRRWFSR